MLDEETLQGGCVRVDCHCSSAAKKSLLIGVGASFAHVLKSLGDRKMLFRQTFRRQTDLELVKYQKISFILKKTL